jgi:hypothetical protein
MGNTNKPCTSTVKAGRMYGNYRVSWVKGLVVLFPLGKFNAFCSHKNQLFQAIWSNEAEHDDTEELLP